MSAEMERVRLDLQAVIRRNPSLTLPEAIKRLVELERVAYAALSIDLVDDGDGRFRLHVGARITRSYTEGEFFAWAEGDPADPARPRLICDVVL